MLKLSRKADYGLISLKHIAMKRSSASAREIAESYGIPLPLLSKVLQKLARTGFCNRKTGRTADIVCGSASEITALEVIRTIDGPVFLTSCSTGSTGVRVRIAVMCGSRSERCTMASSTFWRA